MNSVVSYSPPHVVHEAYMRSCTVHWERLWTKYGANVYVIDDRLDPADVSFLSLASLTLMQNGKVRRITVTDLFKPVYFGEPIPTLPGYDDIVSERPSPDKDPFAWWLRLDLVYPNERIRFAALPAKVNMTEWLNMGKHRELYSYDGFGFTLREKDWGRE